MKKYKIIISVFLIFSLMLPMSVSAFEVPADSYYVNARTSELGEIMIYFPYNMPVVIIKRKITSHIVRKIYHYFAKL